MDKQLNVENLRRKAKDLKRAKGIPHMEALDAVAMDNGFDCWNDLIANENTEERLEKKRGTARTPFRLRRERQRSFDEQPPEGSHGNPFEDPSLARRILRP